MKNVRFEISWRWRIKVSSSGLTMYGVVVRYQNFRGPCYLHCHPYHMMSQPRRIKLEGKTHLLLCMVSATKGVNALGFWISHGLQMTHGFISVDTWTHKTHICGHQKIHTQSTRIHYIPWKLVSSAPFPKPKLSGHFFPDHTVNTEVHLKIFNAFVNQMTDEALTTSYLHQERAR